MRPLVSVIIPVFNRRKLLFRALDSVLAQTYRDYEVIVVDDGSTDNLSADKTKLENLGVRYFLTDNKGVAAARNFGVSQARGDWIAFLDSDDEWLPSKLECQLNALSNSPKFNICHSEEIWVRNGRFVNACKHHAKASGDCFARSLELCCISPSSVLLRKSLFEELGAFDERLKACEDYDLWLRLSAREEVLLLDEPLVRKYGGHADQLSRAHLVMDRFRVYSMLKLLLEESLTNEQQKQTLKEMEKKSSVIVKGAKKRGNLELAQDFARLSMNCSDLLQSVASSRELFEEMFSDLYLKICNYVTSWENDFKHSA